MNWCVLMHTSVYCCVLMLNNVWRFLQMYTDMYWCVLLCFDVHSWVLMIADVCTCAQNWLCTSTKKQIWDTRAKLYISYMAVSVILWTDLYYCVLIRTHVYWCELMCADAHLRVLIRTNVWRCLLMCINMYRCVLERAADCWCLHMCTNLLCTANKKHIWDTRTKLDISYVVLCVTLFWFALLCVD